MRPQRIGFPIPCAAPLKAWPTTVRHRAAGRAMTWSIAPGHAMSATVAGPAPSVVAIDGTVWVTQAGDPRDHVLHPGERLALGGRGRVAIQALGERQTAVRTLDLA